MPSPAAGFTTTPTRAAAPHTGRAQAAPTVIPSNQGGRAHYSPKMEIPPTHYAASRAASVAENCINYQQGTPHKVFLVQTVQQASKEVSRGARPGIPPPPQPPAPPRKLAFL